MNWILQKVLLSSIYIWLFTSFFLFSHILYILWIEKSINIFSIWGFEWIKSVFINILWIISFIFLLLFQDKFYEKNNIKWLYSWIIITAIIISSIFTIWSWDFFFWLSEKHHWWLYYISLVFIFLAISIWYKKSYYYKTIKVIFIFFVILWLYSIFQKLWIDPLSSLYKTRVSLTRVFWTLWNANYLAGLCIVLFPLIHLLRNKYYKYILFIYCFIVLLLTGSYFWIAVLLIYLLYKSYTINKKIFLWWVIIFLTIFIHIFNTIWIEKIWSLKARPYIWISSISAIIESPKSFLIWNWPDTLQEVFDSHKHEKLNIYETSTYTADRSHNIFIDLIYFFWIFWWWIIIFFLLYAVKISQNIYIKESIILFLIFFSFNIPVTIHFIIIVLLLARIYQNKWK